VEALGIKTYQVEHLARDISPLKEHVAVRELTELFTELKPDVVHLNSSKAGYTGARAAKAANVPRIIFTAHGWAFTEPRNFISKSIFKSFQKKTVLLSDVTIAVSEFIKTHTNGWNLPPGRVSVIRHGIPTLPFLSREEARAELIKIDASLKNAGVLWAGTIAELHANKGIDIGVTAWKKAKPESAAWVVIGGGEEQEKLTRHAKDDATIHLIGFLPDAWKYLKAFDLFILPSRTEALGYVVLEAGAAGVPVVTSDFGGAKEALGDAPPAALFKSENAASLADSIKTFLGHLELRQKTGSELKQHIEQSFTQKRVLDETFARYAP
jgi:glycosyltransferase involved in cell wall biosynthesis